MKYQSILTAVAVATLIPSIAAAESGFFVAASVGRAELSEAFDGAYRHMKVGERIVIGPRK